MASMNHGHDDDDNDAEVVKAIEQHTSSRLVGIAPHTYDPSGRASPQLSPRSSDDDSDSANPVGLPAVQQAP